MMENTKFVNRAGMKITKKISPDDAADALAVGLTAIYYMEHKKMYRSL